MRRAALFAALALLAGSAAGQGYDPRLEWRTLRTAHFRLHFHDGLEPLAQRAAAVAERAHDVLVPVFGHEPAGPVELVLSDGADDANGSAEVIPRNVVRIFAVAPEALSTLSDYGDWLEAVIFHEYAHILHLDDVGGLPRLFNALFGKVAAPSGLGPPWLIEGIGVLRESGPGAGRNESALFDMWARALVLERGLPGLDALSSDPLHWPRGNLWYLLGGRFLAFLRDRHGEAALRAFVHDQGTQVWPYFMNTLAERHFGRSFDLLWADFGAELQARYRAEVEALRAAGASAPRPITHRGGRLASPRFAPDGRSIVYADQGSDVRPGLRRAALDGQDLGRMAVLNGATSFALLGARQAVVADGDFFQEYRILDDLYLLDLSDGTRRRVTWGERATDPEVTPGGAEVVYVARLPGGEHALRRRRLDGGPPETLLSRPGAQLFLPRVSPDGRRIALEIQENGRRDVAVLEDGALAFVTDDDALDTGPTWSPDGKVLFFSSDRSGIYDLYAFEGNGAAPVPAGEGPRPMLAGRLRRVTRMTSGALQADVSPDGGTLAFLTYSAAGYDVALLPIAPETWIEPPAPPVRPAHRAPPPPEPAKLPVSEYRALDTLGPGYWLPLAGGDGAGMTLGAFTSGTDVVGRHSWAATGEWGVRSREAAYDLAYGAGWMHPLLTLESSRFITTAPDRSGRLEAWWTPLDAAFTFSRTHQDRLHTVTMGWRELLLRPIGAPPAADPAGPGGTPYRGATASELRIGLALGNAQRFAYSISREAGGILALQLRYASPDLGGDQSYALARFSGSQYLRLPGTRHGVLALHGSIGASSGSLGLRAPFSVGGVSQADLAGLVAGALGGGFPGQSDQLRGYPQGAYSGSTLVSGTAELRFPLFAPTVGHSTWPFLLRRVHGALFLDAGGAFANRDGGRGRELGDLRRLRFGTGGELLLEIVLGYRLRTDLRIGLARGLGPLLAPAPRPADPLASTQLYVTVGDAF